MSLATYLQTNYPDDQRSSAEEWAIEALERMDVALGAKELAHCKQIAALQACLAEAKKDLDYALATLEQANEIMQDHDEDDECPGVAGFIMEARERAAARKAKHE